ncbi:MAG: rhomboid family intramembrane serine protease [Promethearchaeota archaeon]
MDEVEIIRPLKPFMTYTLILLNVFVHILQYLSPEITYNYSLVPAQILQAQNLHTLITCMFLHSDPIHLFYNMYFLYLFGPTVEQEMHPLLYIPLYLFAGIIGSLGHTFLTVTLEGIFIPYAAYIRTLGASGAIFGILAAYAYLMPRRRIRVWTGYGETNRYIAAWNFIMIYFIFEVVLTLIEFGSGVAHGAHVFGFVGGYIFAIAYQRLRLIIERKQIQKEYHTPKYYSKLFTQ